MKLSRLTQPMPATVPVETAAGTVQITYDRAVLTPKYIRDDLAGPVWEKLADILLDWDVESDDDTPSKPAAGLDAAARAAAWKVILPTIPQEHLNAIYSGVWDDFLGVKPPKSVSPAS